MHLDDLRLIGDIARLGSFAGAARARNVDPAWISRKISDIEALLGFRLFQRTTRRLALTEAGRVYWRSVEGLVEAHERARDDALSISHGPSGLLRITATMAFGQKILTPLLPRFCASAPHVEIELLLDDANLDLVDRRVDLALRLGPEVTGDFIAAKLCDTRYRLCVSPDYLAAQGAPARPADLARRDCLRFALPGLRNQWIFRDSAGVEEQVEIGGKLSASGAIALRQLALAGMGPALLAGWLVEDDMARGDLVELFPDLQVTPTNFATAIWLLYPSRSFLPGKVRAMIDFLRAEAAGWRFGRRR